MPATLVVLDIKHANELNRNSFHHFHRRPLLPISFSILFPHDHFHLVCML